LDTVFVFDTRFSFNFDNSIDSDSYLSGPELYPGSVQAVLDQLSLSYTIDEATINTTVADGVTLPELALSVDGGSTWNYTASNTNSQTWSISEGTTTATARLTLGRHGTRSTASPTTGFRPMKVDLYELLITASAVGSINELDIVGNHEENLTRIMETSVAGYRYVMDHSPNSLDIEFFPADTEKSLPDLTVKNRRPTTDVGEYANKVHVYGGDPDNSGSKPYAVVQDDNEVNEVGEEPEVIIDPQITTVDDAENRATAELFSRVKKRTTGGSLEVVAKHPLPGYTYPVDTTGDGSTTKLPLERVEFEEGPGVADGLLAFEDLVSIEKNVVRAERTTRDLSALL
jgi:hypothetical protein